MAYNSTIDKAVDDILIYGNTAKDGSGTSYVPLLDTDGHLQLDVLTSALPTGASTSANQTTIIGHLDGVEGLLTTIDADTGSILAAVDGIEALLTTIDADTSNLSVVGGGLEATAIRVTIANDSTGVLSIDDNGGSITVDGTFWQATQPVSGTVTAELSATDNAVLDNIDADLTTIIGHVDGIETLIGTTNTTLTTIDGRVDGIEGLLTTIDADTGSIMTAVQLLDDVVATLGTTTYTEAATKGNIIAAVRRDANTTLVDTTNEIAPLQVNATGELKVVQIQALPAGTNAIGKLAANSGVDIGDVDILSIIPGTGATNLGKAVDSAPGATDTGVMALAIRDDTLNIRSGTEGDYEPLHTNANGALWSIDVNSAAMLTALQLLDDTIFADDAAFTVGSSKVSAVGMLADSTATDSVDEGDIGVPRMSLDRKQIVTNAPTAELHGLSVFNASSSDGATALTSTAQVIKASAGQVYGWYIYNPNATAQFVQLYNTAAASVTVGTTSPLFMLTIPATAGANVEFTNGITFSNAGFSIAATSTAGGNGAPTTALDAVIFYK